MRLSSFQDPMDFLLWFLILWAFFYAFMNKIWMIVTLCKHKSTFIVFTKEHHRDLLLMGRKRLVIFHLIP
jgi:hypothetical protein